MISDHFLTFVKKEKNAEPKQSKFEYVQNLLMSKSLPALTSLSTFSASSRAHSFTSFIICRTFWTELAKLCTCVCLKHPSVTLQTYGLDFSS